jgi:hypothetical protein
LSAEMLAGADTAVRAAGFARLERLAPLAGGEVFRVKRVERVAP